MIMKTYKRSLVALMLFATIQFSCKTKEASMTYDASSDVDPTNESTNKNSEANMLWEEYKNSLFHFVIVVPKNNQEALDYLDQIIEKIEKNANQSFLYQRTNLEKDYKYCIDPYLLKEDLSSYLTKSMDSFQKRFEGIEVRSEAKCE